MSYNFALIGASGYVAPKHMKAIKDVGGNLVAALDPHDSVGILDSYFPDCQFFTEFERFDRFCSKQVDNGRQIHFVSICSPNYLHDAHCRFAMRIGANAICEKPLALKYRNLEELKIIEKKTGSKVYTILQLRLNVLQQNLHQAIQRSEINVDIIRLNYHTPRGDWYDYTWKAESQKSGGLITNIGIHLVDMLLWMFEGFSVEPRITASTEHRVSGQFHFKKGSWNPMVEFVLSIEKGIQPKRELLIGNSCHELSESFTDLHTDSYKQILAGSGFGIDDAIPAVKMCEILRNHVEE